MLFCAALAIFFLSIFTPLWLALSTTVCVIMHPRVLLGEAWGVHDPPPLHSPCKPFLVTLNKTQHEVRNDNLVSTLYLTQCDPPLEKSWLCAWCTCIFRRLLVQATTNGLFKFDPSTGLTTFCFFFMYKPIKYYYFYFYHYNFQELDVVEK